MEKARLIAKLTLSGSKGLLPPLCSFVRELALQEGFSDEDARTMELIAEEASLNVIQHALGQKRDEYYEVHVETRPGQFVLAVQDQGIPIDWKRVESGEESGLGMHLIRSFADQVRFVNLGKGGKRIEFIKNLLGADIPGNTHIEEPEYESEAPKMAPMDVPISFRRVREDDLLPLTRCMYQVYGYSYKEVVYFPEKMKELIDDGLLVSVVAVTPDGEIIAHQGLKKEEKDAPIAEITMGVVDPRFRGRRLFERIKTYSYEEVRKEGVYGLFVEIVANHPYSQRANLAMGAKETGILLGFIPPERVFRGITASEGAQERASVVVSYTRLAPEPQRVVYPPFHHETMIRKIYEYGGFDRIIRTAQGQDKASLPERSLVDMKSVSDSRISFLRVLSYGRDFEDLIRVRLREQCIGRFECIYVDLPMGDPYTQSFCAALGAIGFFFAGLIPELHDGDVLRMQYLNNISIDPRNVVVVSEFGRQLFDYVLESWGYKGMSGVAAVEA
ncbi:MAG: ATP-binding protein [Acidobacteriota bacterium]